MTTETLDSLLCTPLAIRCALREYSGAAALTVPCPCCGKFSDDHFLCVAHPRWSDALTARFRPLFFLQLSRLFPLTNYTPENAARGLCEVHGRALDMFMLALDGDATALAPGETVELDEAGGWRLALDVLGIDRRDPANRRALRTAAVETLAILEHDLTPGPCEAGSAARD